jgi:hypothetical protein
MTTAGTPRWRKSSFSGANGQGDCVEIAFVTEKVMLRDSKNIAGQTLGFSADVWRSFVALAKCER